MMTKVLLVDDDRELGEMLTEYLDQEGFAAMAVQDGETGVRAALSGAYAIVVLDVMMPGCNGIEALRRIRAQDRRLPVLMLSTYPDRQYAVRSLKLGAAGYLNKSADSEQLIDAIRRVALGKLFITPGVAELMAEQLVPTGTRAAGVDAPLHERLSHREYQVFRLLAAGRSVGEIAEQLVLSSNTVSTYRARILEKTGVRNDVELALYAVREGL